MYHDANMLSYGVNDVGDCDVGRCGCVGVCIICGVCIYCWVEVDCVDEYGGSNTIIRTRNAYVKCNITEQL